MRNSANTQPSRQLSAQRSGRGSRRTIAAIAAGALLFASCGGDDDASSTTPATTPSTDAEPSSSTQPSPDTTETTAPTTATTSPTTSPTTTPAVGSVLITSEDGNLTLEVRAADAERVSPSIRILDPSEWPAELGDAEQLPGVTIYEMEPDGAVFDEPVTVTRRLDIASFGESIGAFDVPLVVPFTQEDDGRFVPLADLEVTRIGSTLFASGTTTHFSPLGTIDLGLDARVPGNLWPAEPITESVDPAAWVELGNRMVRDDAENFQFHDVPVVPGAASSAAGQEPEVVPRRIDLPDAPPIFGPLTVERVERTSPSQTAEQDAVSLHRLFAASDEVPSSPLFAPDGVEVPLALRVVVSQYIVTVDDAERERLRAVADELAAGANLEWSVFHTPIGGFPSYSRSKLTNVKQLGEGEQLFAALYSGDFGPGAQLVDLAEMKWDGDAYIADVGLASYGDVNQALIVTTEESAFGDDMTPQEYFDSVMSFPGDVMALFLPDPFRVDATEGVLFDGDPGFQIYEAP